MQMRQDVVVMLLQHRCCCNAVAVMLCDDAVVQSVAAMSLLQCHADAAMSCYISVAMLYLCNAVACCKDVF